MMSYRTHPLYSLARAVSGQPINWDNLPLALLQYEMRVDYVEKMSTDNLIKMVVGVDDFVDWTETLTDIIAQPVQQLTYDAALGEGRC
jgi:hypothetical protein